MIELTRPESPLPPGTPSHQYALSDSLLGRIYLVATILLLEYTAIVSAPHPWCHVHPLVAGTIVLCTVFLFLTRQTFRDRPAYGFNCGMLVVYGCCLAITVAAHLALLHGVYAGGLMVGVWTTAIVLSGFSLLGAMVALELLRGTLRPVRKALLYAACASVFVTALSNPIQALWDAPDIWSKAPLQRTTFEIVRQVLQWMYGYVWVDLPSATIGLPHFAVTIKGSCAGIEGLTLVLLFSCGWLLYARDEVRFPRALLLVPCALTAMYVLNIARIVALLSIGNAGYADIATHGFHSEAGWFAFNAVSIGMLLVAGRIPWLQRTPSGSASFPAAAAPARNERNVAAVYLLPFLAILAAGSVAKAASSGLEWMYPLRLMAAGVVFWKYRTEYLSIDRRFTWRGPVVGAAVFVVWMMLARKVLRTPAVMPESLRAASMLLSGPWVLARLIGAIATVPIAEELAFRGFLLRRIDSADVEVISYARVGPLAIMVSSAAFGALHGPMWPAGVLAGVAYSLLLKRTARLGEAVAAHATTNLLLAVWVLARGEWNLW